MIQMLNNKYEKSSDFIAILISDLSEFAFVRITIQYIYLSLIELCFFLILRQENVILKLKLSQAANEE